MMARIFLFSILFISSFFINSEGFGGPEHGKLTFCYIASWSTYRKVPVKFDLGDIEPSLCTHLVYVFAILDEESSAIKSLEPWLDIERDGGNYKRLSKIKKDNPHLKIIIAIGGWNEGSVKFSNMSADPTKRKKFVISVLDYFKNYEFDGLLVSWSYPTQRGGNNADKENFVTLIKELKYAFVPYGYILCAALSGIRDIIITAYDLPNLNRYLDFIHVIAYDYHGPWEKLVGPNAPLKGYYKHEVNNVEYAIKHLLSFGISPHKMVLGIPFYGHTFILKDANATSIEFGSTPSLENGFRGPYLDGTNFYGYNEVCLDFNISLNRWTYYWDERSLTPYLRDKDRVVTFENSRSIVNKIKFAIDYDLGGFFTWSIDTDNFNEPCIIGNDTYAEYKNRFNQEIKQAPNVLKVIKELNLPHVNSINNLGENPYVILNDELIFHEPEENFNDFPLLRTIKQATYIALEEKRITDAIKRGINSEAQNRFYSNENNVPCVRTCVEVCFNGPYDKIIKG